MNVLEMLAGRLPDSVGLLVVDAAVKGFLVLGVTALVATVLNQRSAAVRHLVWTLGVLAILLIPILSWIMPSVQVPVPASWVGSDDAVPKRAFGVARFAAKSAYAEAIGRANAVRERSRLRVPPVAHAHIAEGRVHIGQAHTAEMGSAVVIAGTPSRASRVWLGTPPSAAQGGFAGIPIEYSGEAVLWPAIVVGVWLIGVMVVWCCMLVSYMRLAVLRHTAKPIHGGRCVRLADDIAWELGVREPVTLVAGREDAMPMTWGVIRPVVLLPSTALAWTRERLEMVLRHELAHVARRDASSQRIAEIACAIHWYNPLVWLAAARMRAEREHACDDLVLEAGSGASDYATELLAIARTLRARTALDHAAIAMARRSHLKDRLTAVLDDARPRARPTRGLLAAAALCATGIVLPLSALEASTVQSVEVKMRPVPVIEIQVPSAVTAPRVKIGVPVEVEAMAPVLVELPVIVAPRSLRIEGLIGHVPVSPRPPTSAGDIGTITVQIPSPATRSHAFASILFDPALASAAQPQVAVCSRSEGGNTSINRNDDDWRIHWTGRDCAVDIRIDGEIDYDPFVTTILAIPEGGLVRFEEQRRDGTRRLEIRPAAERLDYAWQVNGRDAAFDDEGRAWLSAMMQELARKIGFGAEERAAAILERDGPDGLLREIEELWGDRTRSRYYHVLLTSDRIDASVRANVLRQVDGSIRSDREKANLLMEATDGYSLSEDARRAYVSTASGIASDREKVRVLATLVERASLNPTEQASILASAQTVQSDRERNRLLASVHSRVMTDPVVQLAYIEAARTMASDREKQQAFTRLFAEQQLAEHILVAALDGAREIESDRELAHVLTAALETQQISAAARDAFLRALDSIESSRTHDSVASALLQAQERRRVR